MWGWAHGLGSGGECPIYFTRGSMEGKGGGGMCGVGRMDWEGGEGGVAASIELIRDVVTSGSGSRPSSCEHPSEETEPSAS